MIIHTKYAKCYLLSTLTSKRRLSGTQEWLYGPRLQTLEEKVS